MEATLVISCENGFLGKRVWDTIPLIYNDEYLWKFYMFFPLFQVIYCVKFHWNPSISFWVILLNMTVTFLKSLSVVVNSLLWLVTRLVTKSPKEPRRWPREHHWKDGELRKLYRIYRYVVIVHVRWSRASKKPKWQVSGGGCGWQAYTKQTGEKI